MTLNGSISYFTSAATIRNFLEARLKEVKAQKGIKETKKGSLG
jgi:hypothetical protein